VRARAVELRSSSSNNLYLSELAVFLEKAKELEEDNVFATYLIAGELKRSEASYDYDSDDEGDVPPDPKKRLAYEGEEDVIRTAVILAREEEVKSKFVTISTEVQC
jgi:hypothetical protein